MWLSGAHSVSSSARKPHHRAGKAPSNNHDVGGRQTGGTLLERRFDRRAAPGEKEIASAGLQICQRFDDTLRVGNSDAQTAFDAKGLDKPTVSGSAGIRVTAAVIELSTPHVG